MSGVRQFATVMGVVFLLIGVGGFIGPLVQGSTGEFFYSGQGELLGLFHIDPLHNIAHLLFGVAGVLAGMGSWSASRSYAQITGIAYGLLFLLGLYTASQNVGLLGDLLMFNAADNVLHVLITAAALYFGFSSAYDRERTTV
ncbi:MAG: DUF4383 domain-containing protein [Chloroflexota bacterium]